MNGIAEGVRQVRGTAVNQVADVEHVVVAAGTGVPTSGLVLANSVEPVRPQTAWFDMHALLNTVNCGMLCS